MREWVRVNKTRGLFGAQAVARVRMNMRSWSRNFGLPGAKFCRAIGLNVHAQQNCFVLGNGLCGGEWSDG